MGLSELSVCQWGWSPQAPHLVEQIILLTTDDSKESPYPSHFTFFFPLTHSFFTYYLSLSPSRLVYSFHSIYSIIFSLFIPLGFFSLRLLSASPTSLLPLFPSYLPDFPLPVRPLSSPSFLCIIDYYYFILFLLFSLPFSFFSLFRPPIFPSVESKLSVVPTVLPWTPGKWTTRT